MSPTSLVALSLQLLFAELACFSSAAQMVADKLAELPKDPQAVFAAAAPFYDYSATTLKPFHLKATYQLYENGLPGEQGTFEYWWASPQVYRRSWTRTGVTQTYWHLADGKHVSEVSGRLNFFERKLSEALLSPLPTPAELDPSKVRLDAEKLPIKESKIPCFMVVPQMHIFGATQNVPLGLFPTYCFNPAAPILLASYSLGTVEAHFNKVGIMQGHYLARSILLFESGRKVLEATVDSVTGLAPTDPALIPPENAERTDVDKVNMSGGIAVGMLLKKQVPVYPQDAKDAHVSGTVVLQATIGTDGGIHDLRVVSAPWPSLAASSLSAVSHWEYRPYLLKGEPVEVETTINVIFSLGP
jgi:TonB family protein